MTYEPDDIAHVRLPLISLVLLVALPAALIPVLQFLSVSHVGGGASAVGSSSGAASLAALPGSVIGGSVVGLLLAYVIGGRKAMFLAVLIIVAAVAAMLAMATPLAFQWGRTALNLAAGALLVLPILVLGHYGSHRQIARGMPGLILGPFVLVALIGLMTRPEIQDRIAALTARGGLDVVEPMGWLAIALTFILVLSLFRAMGRIRGGRPNALFSPELRADARAALGFILTGPQIYALLIAMVLTGHAATTYLGDFARKSPLGGFGMESTIAATICLGLGGFVFTRIFGPRRRQLVPATTMIFVFITTALMVATDIMFVPSADSQDIFMWPYTQEQLVLLILTCAAMAMLGAAYAMIWLAVVEVGIGALATTLLITVLVARIVAPATVPLLPIPDMWLSTGLLGASLVLVTLAAGFRRRGKRAAATAPSHDFATFESREPNEQAGHVEPGFDTDPIDEVSEPVAPQPSRARRATPREAIVEDPTTEPAAPRPAPREPVMRAAPAAPDAPPQTPRAHDIGEAQGEPPRTSKSGGGLPWKRRRAPRNAPAEPSIPGTPPVPERREPRRRSTAEESAAPTPSAPNTRHEAVHDTHIDWAKLGATVEDGRAAPDEPDTGDARRPPEKAPPAKDRADRQDDVPANRRKPTEPGFTRHDSTIFDFDRLRANTRQPDPPTDQTDEEKE